MKRSWTSNGLNMSHGTASKTYVARIMSGFPCGKLTMPFSGPSFTTTPPLWRQSQLGKRWCSITGSLGRPAVNASESNCAHFLDARLELKIGLLSGPWYVPNVMQNATRRTDKQQMQTRVRNVATLARTGEKGRALAAARNAPSVPVTEQIVHEIKSLYPADPELPAPVQAPVSALFLSEMTEHVPITLRKMPRLSEPRPLGMRAEHWYDFGSLAGDSDLFVQIIAHIAAAAVPNSVLQYLKAGQITPLAKTDKRPQTTPHDVFSPQTCAQISNGSKERINGQVCGTLAVRCWKTRRSKHDDQDHPSPRGG